MSESRWCAEKFFNLAEYLTIFQKGGKNRPVALCQGWSVLSRVLSELISCPGLALRRATRQFHPSQENGGRPSRHCHPPRRTELAQGSPSRWARPVLPDPLPLPAPKFAPLPVAALRAARLRLPGEDGAVTWRGRAPGPSGDAPALHGACLHGGGIRQLTRPRRPFFF